MDRREYDEMIERGYDPGLLGPRPDADSQLSSTTSETSQRVTTGSRGLKVGLAVAGAVVVAAMGIAVVGGSGGEGTDTAAQEDTSYDETLSGLRESNADWQKSMEEWETYESTRQTYTPGTASGPISDSGARSGSSSGSNGGGGGVAAARSGGGSAGAAIREESPIYHNSTDWQWLAEAGHVRPGVMLATQEGASCSAGFMVAHKGRSYILIAGHCGEVGTEWYVPTDDGRNLYVGRMVESEFDHVGGSDYGLITLDDSEAPWTSETPLGAPLVGWRSPEWVDQVQPQICRLGYRTGLSCGDYIETGPGEAFQYRSITDRGDSGGPIFALHEDQLYALGVSSGYADTDATRATAQRVDWPITGWGLNLYRG